jgi:hypothetical protein
MSRIRQTKTTFTSGEISRRLLGRGDLSAYENGALSLRNVFIHPTGGLTRRSGLAYVDTVAGAGRLIDFEFNTEQTYLLALTDLQIDVYQDGTKITTLVTPWTLTQISQLYWTQSADTLLICHPDVRPQKITRDGVGAWSINPWEFFVDDDGVKNQPYFKFANDGVTVMSNGVTGSVTLTASADVFDPLHAGTRMRVGGREIDITTSDWEEEVCSPLRGWPTTVCFHQDRLIIGGSRDLPNRLWMSKTGDIWNFDLGEGLDDESIEFSIFSDQVNAIRAVFSGRDLQVFTSGAEWQVTGSPLTPNSVQIERQTRIGSLTDRTVLPVDIEGATIFVARNGAEIREFLYTDLEAAYQATDVSLLAQHLIDNPRDQAFDKRNRLLHFVLGNGDMATLTNYRVEKVSAWTLQKTEGQFLSVAVTGDDVYVLVHRNGQYMIEYFDDTIYSDSTLKGEAVTATTTWSGLDHLDGLTVMVKADDIVRASVTVVNGTIILDDPANTVEIGLPYTHIIEPLPPSNISGAGRATRLIEAIYRVEDTSALRLDMGRGLDDVPLRDFDDGQILDAPIVPVSRDITVKSFGWSKDLTKSLWRIEQDTPLPFTLLSVTTELKVND